MTAVGLADELAAALRRAARLGEMLRLVRQFVVDVDRDPNASMIAAEPATTGDRRWDALVAGVVEDVAYRHRLPTPAWTRHPSRYLDEWWFVTDVRALRPWALKESPPAVANHGVFIRRASLVNV